MTPYPWSCLACGATNTAGTDECQRCNCLAQATYKQIEEYRHRFLEGGGKLEPAAAPLAAPNQLKDFAMVLLWPVWLILGIWPSSDKDKK
jgi:hypothetical protein